MIQAMVNAGFAWNGIYNRAVRTWYSELAIGTEFTGEDVNLALLDMGVPEPHHWTVWGGKMHHFVRPLRAQGRVIFIGWKEVSSTQAHSRPYRLYRKIK